MSIILIILIIFILILFLVIVSHLFCTNNIIPPNVLSRATNIVRNTSKTYTPVTGPDSSATSEGRSDQHKLEDQEIREVQESTIWNFALSNHGVDLIIATSSNYDWIGGYCLDFKDKILRLYRMRTRNLIWPLSKTSCGSEDNINHSANSSELNMKCLLQCLFIWRTKIDSSRKFTMFCEAQATDFPDGKLGRKALKLLNHIGNCQNVVRDNKNVLINKPKDILNYAHYVQPAKDCVYGDFVDAACFLEQIYKLEDLRVIVDDELDENIHRRIPTNAEMKRIIYKQLKKSSEFWLTPCNKCGFYDDEQFLKRSRQDVVNTSVQLHQIEGNEIEIG